MSTVSIVDVGKSYGALKVMEDVSFEIADGEFLILVGPSGCGKSTLLRMLAGLEQITAGQISIGERVVNDVLPKDRNIAMVFQNYALYPHKTVAENMGFALKLRGTRRDDIDRAVNRVAEILGLQDLLERYPKQLSGGQRQRVAMGRAIVREPDVFLFDEPLSNLDAKLRVQMRSEIKALHDRLRSTIVYVTHDQIEAMTMADRIVVLNGGRVEQIGTPLELFDSPRNLFVATFIGSPSMNLIEGQIEDRGGQRVLRASGDVLIPLGSDAPDTSSRIVVGIRPEHLSLAPSGTANTVKARVVVAEPMGSDTQLQLALGDHRVIGFFHERVKASTGDELDILLAPEALHFFDADTGNRL